MTLETNAAIADWLALVVLVGLAWTVRHWLLECVRTGWLFCACIGLAFTGMALYGIELLLGRSFIRAEDWILDRFDRLKARL